MAPVMTGPSVSTDVPSVSAEVRSAVAAAPTGSFFRVSDFVDSAHARGAVRVSFHRVQRDGDLVSVGRGMYYKGTSTRFGMTPPPPDAVAYQVAKDRGYDSGVGPAGFSAARALGLTTQMPRVEEIAVPGRSPADVKGVRFTSRSPAGRVGLRPAEVAVVEMLREWPRYSEASWDVFVQVVKRLVADGRVDLASVVAAAERSRNVHLRDQTEALRVALTAGGARSA